MQPAAAPKPALRYLLLPELKEMNPGNPIQNYLKCFMEQQKFFFDKEAFERREKLLAMPLKELPARELQEYGGLALRQADWAARLDNPDWQILLNLKAEGIYLLIPDVQELRPLANALKVRMRAEVALGRFDDALRTAKTMFALARHLGEHPTFVGNLFGFAVANAAIGPLEEMLEQPGCPNLYWALTHLPNPLVPVDQGRARRADRDHPVDVPRPGRQRPDERGPTQQVHPVHGQAPQDRVSRQAGARACGRGWTRGPRTRGWSAPRAAVSSRSASRRSRSDCSRPTR